MPRLRYADIQNSRIPAKVGVCSDSAELLAWTCAFETRAAAYGRWWGSTQLSEFCVTGDRCGACIVLPPQVAVIEAANLNGQSINVQGPWGTFDRPHLSWGQCGASGSCFSNNLPCTDVQNFRCGCGCGCQGVPQMIDMGMVASYSVTTDGQKIRVYPSQAVDVGKKVVIQGVDSNGVWVRTEFSDGVVQDGEELILALPFVESDTTWGPGAPYLAYKEVTTWRVLVFALDSGDEDSLRQLADYGPTETNPTYRKVKLPSINTCSCSGTSTLKAMVSLQPGAITAAQDWLLFADALPAYSDGILAEKYYENGDLALGDAYFFGTPKAPRNGRGVLRSAIGMGALGFLESQLRKLTGDKTTVRMQRDGLYTQGFV